VLECSAPVQVMLADTDLADLDFVVTR